MKHLIKQVRLYSFSRGQERFCESFVVYLLQIGLFTQMKYGSHWTNSPEAQRERTPRAERPREARDVELRRVGHTAKLRTSGTDGTVTAHQSNIPMCYPDVARPLAVLLEG